MKTMREWTLDDWCDEIWKTFKHYDTIRTPVDIWSGVVIYSSIIAEGLRTARYNDVLRGISHVFIWISSFVNKCINDEYISKIYKLPDNCLSDIIALQYPNKCGHCLSNPCHCMLKALNIEQQSDKKIKFNNLLRERAYFGDTSHYKDWALNNWVELFEKLYPGTVHIQPAELIGFHLSEEIGEVSRAIRELQHHEFESSYTEEDWKKLKYNLEVEIAHTFSWNCSLFLRIRNILDSLRLTEESRNINEYPCVIYDIGLHPLRKEKEQKSFNKRQEMEPILLFSELIENRFGAEEGRKFVCDDCDDSPCKCSVHLS